jgi:hypothetical protein
VRFACGEVSILLQWLTFFSETYKTCSIRAKRALSAGNFPADALSEIEADVQNTLPNLHIFDAVHGPMHQDLKDVLYAWVVARSDEGLGYVRLFFPSQCSAAEMIPPTT